MVCHGGCRRWAVVLRLPVFLGVGGYGRSRWASVVGCGELLVGHGERRRQIGVCVVVELLRPSQSDEV
jgi:hypothetical protein